MIGLPMTQVNNDDLPNDIRDKINFFSVLREIVHIRLGVIKHVAFISELDMDHSTPYF